MGWYFKILFFFLAYIDDFCLNYYTGGFSNFLSPFTFTSWHSLVKRDFPFALISLLSPPHVSSSSSSSSPPPLLPSFFPLLFYFFSFFFSFIFLISLSLFFKYQYYNNICISSVLYFIIIVTPYDLQSSQTWVMRAPSRQLLRLLTCVHQSWTLAWFWLKMCQAFHCPGLESAFLKEKWFLLGEWCLEIHTQTHTYTDTRFIHIHPIHVENHGNFPQLLSFHICDSLL